MLAPTTACLQNPAFLKAWQELRAMARSIAGAELAAEAASNEQKQPAEMQVDEGDLLQGLVSEVLAETSEGQTEEQRAAVKRALEQLQEKSKKARVEQEFPYPPAVGALPGAHPLRG